MPTVGRALAAERVRQGLDLEDIARVTKIGARSLKSIENDAFEQLPGLVFARNFVRQYADCLRMDPVSIVEQFDREQEIRPPLSTIPRRPQIEIHVPPISNFNLAKVFDNNTVSAFVAFVLTIAVCAGAFAVYQYWSSRHQNAPEPSRARVQATPRTTTAATPPAAQPAKDPEGASTSSHVPETTAVTTPSRLDSPEASPANANVQVSIVANESCWLRITADGNVLFAGTLAPGDTRLINAAGNVNLRAGNAGALSIKLNGTDVPPIGPKGQIRTVVLTRAGAQVRTPSPEPALDF